MNKLDNEYQYKTKHLVIRFYTPSDFNKWQNLFGEMKKKQNQWDWEKEEKSELTSQRFMRKLVLHKKERLNETIYYFCVENSEENLIGICIINNINKKSSTGEIGFQLNNKYWKKGLGKEIGGATANIGLNDLLLQKITAKVNKQNKVSIHILESMNMNRSGENKTQWIYEFSK